MTPVHQQVDEGFHKRPAHGTCSPFVNSRRSVDLIPLLLWDFDMFCCLIPIHFFGFALFLNCFHIVCIYFEVQRRKLMISWLVIVSTSLTRIALFTSTHLLKQFYCNITWTGKFFSFSWKFCYNKVSHLHWEFFLSHNSLITLCLSLSTLHQLALLDSDLLCRKIG